MGGHLFLHSAKFIYKLSSWKSKYIQFTATIFKYFTPEKKNMPQAQSSGAEMVMEFLRTHGGAQKRADLEDLLWSCPGGLGFGVEPQHVIQGLLQLRRIDYDPRAEVITIYDWQKLAVFGNSYFGTLVSGNRVRREELMNQATYAEKCLYQAIDALHAQSLGRIRISF